MSKRFQPEMIPATVNNTVLMLQGQLHIAQEQQETLLVLMAQIAKEPSEKRRIELVMEAIGFKRLQEKLPPFIGEGI